MFKNRIKASSRRSLLHAHNGTGLAEPPQHGGPMPPAAGCNRPSDGFKSKCHQPEGSKPLQPQRGQIQSTATTKGQVLATFQDLVHGAQQKSAALARNSTRMDADTRRPATDAAALVTATDKPPVVERHLEAPCPAPHVLPATAAVQHADPAADSRSQPQLLSKATLQLNHLAEQLGNRVYSYLYQYADMFEQARRSVQELQTVIAKATAGDGAAATDPGQLLEISRACWVRICSSIAHEFCMWLTVHCASCRMYVQSHCSSTMITMGSRWQGRSRCYMMPLGKRSALSWLSWVKELEGTMLFYIQSI